MLPAPITLPKPIVTPGGTNRFAPIHTLCFTHWVCLPFRRLRLAIYRYLRGGTGLRFRKMRDLLNNPGSQQTMHARGILHPCGPRRARRRYLLGEPHPASDAEGYCSFSKRLFPA
jgi:hypothetical protein